MAVEEVVSIPAEVLGKAIVKMGNLVLFLQALGVILILWLVFEIIRLIVNRKNRKRLERIEESIKRIEKKINKIKI